MDKFKPTYDLDAIQFGAADPDTLAMTTTAMLDAVALGFGRHEVVRTVQSIAKKHFYKSMTSIGDHRIWQDVYHVPTEIGTLYIKFSAGTITEFLLLSFKEK